MVARLALTCLLVAPCAEASTAAPSAASVQTPSPIAPTREERNYATGTLVAGLAITTVSLGVGGLVSAHHLDSADPRRRSAGRAGAIPLVGPIVGTRRAPPKQKIDFALMAAYQWSGVAILAGGAVWTGTHRRFDRARGVESDGEATSQVLLAGGLLGSALAYGVTFGIAQRSYDRSEDGRFASRLRLPVVGGVWAARDAPTHVAGYIGVASSIAQVGLLTVAGVALAQVLRRRRNPRSLSVVPIASRSAAQLTATMRF